VITNKLSWGQGRPFCEVPGLPDDPFCGEEPKNFCFAGADDDDPPCSPESQSGFGAAYTYVNANGTQRAFVSANNNNKLKYCSETEEACVNNADCLGASNKCEEGSNSWGLFEIELPIVVPHVCWNTGMNTGAHKRCKDKLGGGTDQPAQTTWKMYTRPTNNNDGLNCRRASVDEIAVTSPPTIEGSFTEDPEYDVWEASRCFLDPAAGPARTSARTPTDPLPPLLPGLAPA
jgi:hypothetical protein